MPAVASLAIAGPRRSVEMHQMTGSVDSTLRLFDLADEGRFLLMSHVWRLDNERSRPLAMGQPAQLHQQSSHRQTSRSGAQA